MVHGIFVHSAWTFCASACIVHGLFMHERAWCMSCIVHNPVHAWTCMSVHAWCITDFVHGAWTVCACMGAALCMDFSAWSAMHGACRERAWVHRFFMHEPMISRSFSVDVQTSHCES